MKALVINEAGGPGQLQETDMEVPEPEAHELRIKVHAVGLNPVDYKLMESPLPEWSFPHVSGLDVSGVVDAVGADVTDWSAGDEVYYHGNMTEDGGFAEFTTTRADVVSSVPKGLTHVEAASMPTAGFTAYQSLYRKAPLRPGQTIMIQAGSGGVGSFAVQLAKHLGLTVFSTCSDENADYVKELGADQVIDYRSQNVVEEVHKLTDGRGVDVVLDLVGRETATEALDYLAFNGHLIAVVEWPDLSHYVAKTLAPSIHEVALGFVYRSDDEAQIKDLGYMARELGELASQGKVKPSLNRTISFQEIPKALQEMQDGHTRGKIVASFDT
ncbi:zinc-binding alcohol dehydrogenase [Marinococcus halophilus]|uniref:Alcohol dehydrogenase n=1 Tax=Marinococcus halophilus TaxID=1371 RepID=A0A510Y4W9_MARHA|nr:zinc-binding dehydrogenase [Marinococcus halophilus]OZT80320.1 zinc-binding alcohol dehydrogenase [Marinococcus halophilus]GEK58384.1 alcohol dehydrogenase [Marinococcus halophilus]